MEGFIPNPKLKLLDQVSEVISFKHYSLRTETTYRSGSSVTSFFTANGRLYIHPTKGNKGSPGSVSLLHGSSSKATGQGQSDGNS
jgi:hypothetical protein